MRRVLNDRQKARVLKCKMTWDTGMLFKHQLENKAGFPALIRSQNSAEWRNKASENKAWSTFGNGGGAKRGTSYQRSTVWPRHTHISAHTQAKNTYMCTQRQRLRLHYTHCFWHQHLQSPPITHLFTLSFTLPQTALHFPFSRHAHGSKAVFLALLDRNTKTLLMHPEEAPLERPPSHPG